MEIEFFSHDELERITEFFMNKYNHIEGDATMKTNEQIEDITHIEYYAIIEFDNNTQNADPSYAYIKPYQFFVFLQLIYHKPTQEQNFYPLKLFHN